MAYAGLGLEGRSAVVIGGTSGIGKHIATGFARAGADVAASSRRQAEVAATADAIEALGRKSLRQISDVNEPSRPSARSTSWSHARVGTRGSRRST